MNILQALSAFFNLAAKSKWVVWPLVAPFLALVVLAVEREILILENVYDTQTGYEEVECPEMALTARTANGTCNDLDNPAWGAVDIRFGRNIDPETLSPYVPESEILDPNPRTVSIELMTRDEFIPVEELNLLATAWIQFMVHDWFDHGDNEKKDPIKVVIGDDDPVFKKGIMKVKRTQRDDTYDPRVDKTVPYRNKVTHWWDGSQIYGSDDGTMNSLRSFQSGKMKMRKGSLPTGWKNSVETGFNKNWWVGLNLFHTMFVREHNRIADMLSQQYPEMSDEELFHKARLVNVAVIAKIHTLEWTTALLDNPVLIQGMYSNWYGLGEGELSGVLGSIAPYASMIGPLFGTDKELNVAKMFDKAINGIVGQPTDTYNLPFSLTEEFVSVYRMHPLLPDSFNVRSHESNKTLRSLKLDQVRDGKAQHAVKKYGYDNLLYTFGTDHPGALTLFNYPKTLQKLKIPFTGAFDLAAVDIIRDRERGVPRYNQFRESIRLKPIAEFEDLFRRFDGDSLSAEHQAVADKLRSVYGTVDKLDLMVGSLAENVRPNGYVFGETAFQIFTLMASRRFMSDRFFTSDFRPEIYTQEGYDWVQGWTLKSVIEDNFPALVKEGLIPDNAFKPWQAVSNP